MFWKGNITYGEQLTGEKDMAIHKLNLVMTYPVKWSVHEVMSNYVQNFYDALNMDQFTDRFKATFSNNEIVMTSDTGFDKEWLFYVGASTKRGGERIYAGRFGEGFKIAALVSIRDMGLGVCMESLDWSLTVKEEDDSIDGTPVKVLAYDISSRSYQDNTVLKLTGATQEHFDELLCQINRFYYEGNGHFDKCIAKGEEYAVYTARRVSGANDHTYGGIFINLQYRESLPLPVFFCLHKYDIPGDDRDRLSLPASISRSVIRCIISYLAPVEALELLEILKPVWFTGVSRSRYRIFYWDTILIDLINKISLENSVKEIFRSRYLNRLIAESRWYIYSRHENDMAHEWLRHSEYKDRKRVCSAFSKLGIEDLYTLCRNHGGFEEEALPNSEQRYRIGILEKIAERFYRELICYDALPECRIILNEKSPLLGKAHSNRETRRRMNGMGLRVVLDIRMVYIKAKLLNEDSLYQAVAVYSHELLHQFGGEESLQFRKALLYMNHILIVHREEIRAYETDWRREGIYSS